MRRASAVQAPRDHRAGERRLCPAGAGCAVVDPCGVDCVALLATGAHGRTRIWTPPICQGIDVVARQGTDCTRISGLLVRLVWPLSHDGFCWRASCRYDALGSALSSLDLACHGLTCFAINGRSPKQSTVGLMHLPFSCQRGLRALLGRQRRSRDVAGFELTLVGQ